MFTDLLLSQLTGARPDLQQTQKFNPRPAGVIRCQSASHAIYEALRANPARWFTHGQIMGLTGMGTKAICWGLIYLQKQGLIEATNDGARGDRYLVYRLNRNAAAPEVGPGRQTERVQA